MTNRRHPPTTVREKLRLPCAPEKRILILQWCGESRCGGCSFHPRRHRRVAALLRCHCISFLHCDYTIFLNFRQRHMRQNFFEFQWFLGHFQMFEQGTERCCLLPFLQTENGVFRFNHRFNDKPSDCKSKHRRIPAFMHPDCSATFSFNLHGSQARRGSKYRLWYF